MRKVRFTVEAAEELEQAAAWYEEECPGLGARFVDATESALTKTSLLSLQHMAKQAKEALSKYSFTHSPSL